MLEASRSAPLQASLFASDLGISMPVPQPEFLPQRSSQEWIVDVRSFRRVSRPLADTQLVARPATHGWKHYSLETASRATGGATASTSKDFQIHRCRPSIDG